MLNLTLGDCLDVLPSVKDNSVDTIITSPPYANKRDYNGSNDLDYIDFISPIILIIKDKIKPSGSIFINIKECCVDGQRSLYVYKLIIHIVEELGLYFIDEYIWNKTNPFPSGSKKRLKDGYERILHFTKSKNYKFYPNNVLVKSTSKWLKTEKNRKNKAAHNTNNNSNMNMSKRISTDMVRPSNVITGSTSNININHPAVYPIYIPEFFIKLTTLENDIILDPFMGSGTTGIACKNLTRKFIGIELDKEYFELSKIRIGTE